MRNDLALIKIQDEITFSVSVKPIKLPESDLNVADLPVVASGWGRLKLVKNLNQFYLLLIFLTINISFFTSFQTLTFSRQFV